MHNDENVELVFIETGHSYVESAYNQTVEASTGSDYENEIYFI